MIPAQRISNQFFSVTSLSSSSHLVIEMSVVSSLLYSSKLPATIPVLKCFLPSIFDSRCFNSFDLPFSKEVEDTEVGHLFEHIFLEYLANLRSKNCLPVRIKAYTEWDWHLNPKGTFHIVVNCENSDCDDIVIALKKSATLLELIYLQSTIEPSSSQVNSVQVLPLINA